MLKMIFDKDGNLLNINDIKQYKLENHCSQMNNIDDPKTIQEKLQWLMLYDNNKLKAECADKIKVHDYCIKKLGKDICVPIIKIYNNTNDINLSELPNKFVLKCNHGCRMNIIVNDKNKIDKNYKEIISKWMNKDFGQVLLEPHYSLIDRKIFAEKLLEDNNNKYLIDYKFWCFNGEPKFYTINSDNGHYRGTDIIYYDIKTDKDMEVYNKSENPIYFNKPKNFELMVDYSKKISEDFKFVRVDFYEIDGQVYLGELTFTPGAGNMTYKNMDVAIKLGNLLKL